MRLPLLTAALFFWACWGPSLASASSAQVPVLELEPNPVFGDQVTATGKNFCGDPGCSAVTVTIEERVAATDVPVSPQGTFEVTLAVIEPAGMYLVTAEQTSATGIRLIAEASLSVPTRDNQVSPPVTTPSPTPASSTTAPTETLPGTPPPGSVTTPTTSATSPASPSPSFSATAGASMADGDGGSSAVLWALLLMVAAALAGVIGWAAIRRGRLLP